MDVTSEQQRMETIEATLQTIEAMRRQSLKYGCCDYCQLHCFSRNSKTLKDDRKLMLQWSMNVLDYFLLNRETAAIALSYSDRFLQTEKGADILHDTKKYQLLCIVALYTSIKLHEPSSVAPLTLVDISRGQYSVEQMEQMEWELLNGLHWRMNPPTALAFSRLYLDLIPQHSLDPAMKTTVYMLARAQTERALGDYSLVGVPASEIALASVLNAFEALGYGDECLMGLLVDRFFSNYFVEHELQDLRRRLYDVIAWEATYFSLVNSRSESPNSVRATIENSSNMGTRKGSGSSIKQSSENKMNESKAGNNNSKAKSTTKASPKGFWKQFTPRSVMSHAMDAVSR